MVGKEVHNNSSRVVEEARNQRAKANEDKADKTFNHGELLMYQFHRAV